MLPPSLPVVVLVEDSDDDVFFFERALKKCDTLPALVRLSDGVQAVRYLEAVLDKSAEGDSAPFPLLFLDLKLPMLSGFEIIQWIADRGALSRFSISILTGSRGEADVARARVLGVTDYFMKPISAESLCLQLKANRARRSVSLEPS